MLQLLAPAKLNLALDITGVDGDGYHLLDMVMLNVDIYDKVSLDVTDGEISIGAADGTPAGEGNIAYRAAMALRAAGGVTQGARIGIEKHIPMQAGMGGGSADAAAVLLGLNTLWSLHWPVTRLAELGLRLGADVPFALLGGCARARGRGEALAAMPLPAGVHLVCAKGEIGLPTAEVYRGYDDMRGKSSGIDIAAFCSHLRSGNLMSLAAVGGNALQAPAVAMHGDIQKHIDYFSEHGAIYSQMTGSGSAVFGVFDDEKTAAKAACALQSAGLWAVCARPCAGIAAQ